MPGAPRPLLLALGRAGPLPLRFSRKSHGHHAAAQCLGVPLRPCDSEQECGACRPLSAVFFCGAGQACISGRRTYQDALTYLYGEMSLGEALWALTVPPLATLVLLCVPGLNFLTIPLMFFMEGCCRMGAVHPGAADESAPKRRAGSG